MKNTIEVLTMLGSILTTLTGVLTLVWRIETNFRLLRTEVTKNGSNTVGTVPECDGNSDGAASAGRNDIQ